MADTINRFSITGDAASLCRAMGIEPPREAEKPIAQLVNLACENAASGRADRVFLYNPDAIALWLYQKYTDLFDDVVKHTRLALPLQTVMPSVTPVCFGSFYTGAYPETHGIRAYAKPVIRIDTFFDALLRAGKKPAIVGDEECSLSHIFLERDMDYFRMPSVEAINDKAMELIEKDEHDAIVVYNGNFDATMHKNGPESEISLAALSSNARAFDRFATAIETKWQKHDTLFGFAMDHGCHEIDGGCGSHGLDMPEDLNILHLYGFAPAR